MASPYISARIPPLWDLLPFAAHPGWPHASNMSSIEDPFSLAACGPSVRPTRSEPAGADSGEISPGEPWPLGAHRCCGGTNLAIFSRHASHMELWVLETPADSSSCRRILLDPQRHRTGDVWHARLHAELLGRCYLFRAGAGTDSAPLLLDPMASLVVPRLDDGGRERRGGTGVAELAVPASFVGVVADQHFDWQGVRAPRHPWGEIVLYETHVRGFTRHASARVRHPGEYLGIIEKIPYLESLGVTALELLPVQAFDECPPVPGGEPPARRAQYWGYDPIALFAPHPGYASRERIDSPVTELKTVVRELHRAGIEVILDVVFNHTGEGGRDGPTYSFRGLDESIYYLMAPGGSGYLDYTGCGNTLNCNHPIVRSMILACLRHWVVHFHIDGFRFDLAAVLGRGEDGTMLSNAPLLEEIAEDPILRDTKLIAEAWDAGGAFQVGRFPGVRWGEWNSRFRDDVRRFWRGDPGLAGDFATRLCGSADLYERGRQTPVKSINFVTSHDGFTLHDLVSYARKHNEANGEGNRDGLDESYSANHGTEGPTPDPAIRALRLRQMKNFLATLLLARGVPMILGGDEFARTQRGNNNAYCQDNELSWHDWSLAEAGCGLVRFVRQLTRLRRAAAVLRAERFYDPREIEWLGAFGQRPDWHGPANRLGCIVRDDARRWALLFNATPERCAFDVAGAKLMENMPRACRVRIDTARASPDDAPEEESAPRLCELSCVQVQPHSLLVLQTVEG